MRCPSCGSLDTQVKDSRPTEDSSVIRRRRVCLSCNFRFTTFERVQLRELMVVKRSGRRIPFDRDKLVRSVEIAVRKRNVDPERVERMINGIVRQLESMGDGEAPSATLVFWPWPGSPGRSGLRPRQSWPGNLRLRFTEHLGGAQHRGGERLWNCGDATRQRRTSQKHQSAQQPQWAPHVGL